MTNLLKQNINVLYINTQLLLCTYIVHIFIAGESFSLTYTVKQPPNNGTIFMEDMGEKCIKVHTIGYTIYIYPNNYKIFEYPKYNNNRLFDAQRFLWGAKKNSIESLIEEIRYQSHYNEERGCCCQLFFKRPTKEHYFKSIIELRMAFNEDAYFQNRLQSC